MAVSDRSDGDPGAKCSALQTANLRETLLVTDSIPHFVSKSLVASMLTSACVRRCIAALARRLPPESSNDSKNQMQLRKYRADILYKNRSMGPSRPTLNGHFFSLFWRRPADDCRLGEYFYEPQFSR